MTVVPSVVTVTGQVTTILVTQAPAASSDDGTLGQSSTEGGGSRGLGGGAIAGIVVGVVGGLALIIGVIVFLFCRKRRLGQGLSRGSSFTADRVGGSSSGAQSNAIPSRQVSQMSQAGLLGGKVPRLQTNGLGGGLGFDTRSAEPMSANMDRRSLGTDQRLNPYAIYKQDDQASSVSLHDDRDYSRQLRVCGVWLRDIV
jgi:cell wall integrity and stress response component